jgi:hypothetical protein
LVLEEGLPGHFQRKRDSLWLKKAALQDHDSALKRLSDLPARKNHLGRKPTGFCAKKLPPAAISLAPVL